MSELITGVISGVVAAVVFYIFLFSVRPKIYVSDKLCEEIDNDGNKIIRIKVVNKTHFMLTNVKYVLRFCRRRDEHVTQIKEIPPRGTPVGFIDKYSKSDKNSEYAIRFSYGVPPDMDISAGWLEFAIHANHGFSNTSACVKKTYKSEDIESGKIFETGTSMKTLAVPNPETA